jgi:flagellar basal-body rod protein FlgF
VQTTGRSLDVAMTGNAWLAVQSLDGTEAYTRAGALQTNAEGQLVTLSGLPVVGDGGPIQLPANAAVDISSDGLITTKLANGRPQQAGRLKLVTPEAAMTRGTDGLFRPGDGNDLTQDAGARLQSGALEGSNVSPVETMVAMISASRQFEQQMRMLQGAEQREQAASKLLGNA